MCLSLEYRLVRRGLELGTKSQIELTLGSNVASPQEVDDLMARAPSAGACILKPAAATFWGAYAGYFQDPDRHVWEVVYNPEFL